MVEMKIQLYVFIQTHSIVGDRDKVGGELVPASYQVWQVTPIKELSYREGADHGDGSWILSKEEGKQGSDRNAIY